ncbi:hypothetical protein CANARDRAFT_24627 [[Candida] arabinofermentans NRRL YB-2248]|uniref:Carboxypeptidase Y inhibitor n=1 Tax=[Candida] arabinofermentans NRRL YB-2248 TaxID=983967 RepID=A0A1E4SWN9_9ASCO|nr:hypothetical protein CANARDRAFT_24627 [[Candida] arabinofermentans NRRL YB-2248]
MRLVTISNSLKDSLSKNEIIPTVIHNKDFISKGFLIISYGEDKEVAMGNTLTPEETQSPPSISFTLNLSSDDSSASNFKISKDDNYTLVFTDPDAPTKGDEKWSEYCHYIVKNIKLNPYDPNELIDASNIQDKLTTAELKGTELMSYIGPGPPPKTGKHRYVFLLYKQKPGLEPEAPIDRPCYGTNIPGYGAEEWSKKYELELLAVNFYYAQNKEQ